MQIYDNPVLSPLTGEVDRYGGLSDVHDEVMAKEELQNVRRELEKSQSELINFTDSVPQILWRAAADGAIDFHNRRYMEITGRDYKAVMGVGGYVDDIHPDDRERFLHLQREAFASKTELRASYRLRHADGSYRWMSLVGRPVRMTEGSDEIRYYGGVSDIHEEVVAHQKVRELNETLEQRVAERTAELMRTERRYAGLFDVSNMTFAEMDFSAAGGILDAIKASGVADLRAHLAAHPDQLAHALSEIRTVRVNEALARMLGYDSVSDLVSHPPGKNAEDGPELLLRQLEMHFYSIDHIDGRTVLLGKNGLRVPVYFTVTRLADGLHLSSHVNLSDQERIEGMRRAAQAELARANRVATVGAFSASIAHELNQPIASMLMDAQTGFRLVERENPDMEAIGRILQRVEKTAQRVAGIVQRTRDTIVAGRRPMTAIDLYRLAFDTRDLLDHDLKRAGVELEILSAPTVPMIKGDPVELQQVFVNLLSNAADAMRDQPGARHIRLEIVTENKAVRVRVTDTGPGIPEEHIERLFEPFFTTKSSGIGMGLQICRSAVEAMGGQLTVANAAGGGASFSFDLPLALEDPASEA
jgi:PAS domain S-box-containing protein